MDPTSSSDTSYVPPPPAPASAKDQQALWKRIEDLRVAMLTTLDRDGTLSARPVTTQRVEPDGTVWFFISASGGIAADLARNEHVNLCYMNVSDDIYVWLRGTGALVDDIIKIKDLWSPMAAAWFPKGPEDPNLGLLKVNVDRGDYWDVDSSKLVQFFSMAKSAITKSPPKDMGKHRQFET